MQVNNRCIKLKLNEGDYSLVTMSLPWPSFIAALDIISTSMDLGKTIFDPDWACFYFSIDLQLKTMEEF